VSTPSDWAPTEVEFKKLDDLPKGKPNTGDAVMAAMRALFKMIHAQSHAYGGKNSKLLPAGIAEKSLLKSVATAQLDEIATASVDDNLEASYMCCNRLQRHLAEKGDEEGLDLLLEIFTHVNKALAISHGK
jgi:uncharacterized tellurite resistance protein B-like protein